MKKTYAFKPLCLLVIIFDAILSISLWRMLSIVGNFLTALTSLSSILRVLLFYLLGVLGVIVMTVFLYLYYVKIEKAKGILFDAIAHTLLAVYFGLQLLGFGNGQTLSANDSLFNIIALFVLVLVVIHVFVMLRLDDMIHVTLLDAYLPAGKNQMMQSQTVEEPIQDISSVQEDLQEQKEPLMTKEKAVAFFKTKNGKIVIGVIGAIVIAFGGYKIWDTFFHKTVIDAFMNVTVSFDGYNTEGEAHVENAGIDYDMTNEDLAQFVGDISFEVENNGTLSNGDQVTVKAVYSKETAKQLKVVLKEETKQFDVSGLTVKYQSVSEIDQKLYQQAYNKAIEESKDVSAFHEDTKETFYKAYYVKAQEEQLSYQRNYLVFVFDETYQSYDFTKNQDVEKKRYACYYTEFDSSYNPDEVYMTHSYLYNDSYTYVENESEIIPSLQRKSMTNYGLSQIEEVNISI